jgi:16S rRNA (adenine1518-N6/adenine1519-N6)-dimethyltransferase
MLNKLYSLMLRHSFKPNFKLDQNFIINEKIINNIIKILDIKKEDIILEIGPGTGFLTNELLKKSKKVIVIEKDKIMCELLKKEFNNYINNTNNNLEIICEDILNIDLKKLNFNKIVSFVPYSISQKLIYKINNICNSVLVLQKEFVDKLNSQEGFENYNAISVISQTYNDIKKYTKINRNSFFPAPKCDSIIVKLIPKNNKYDIKYNKFVKEIFRYSNKNLLKAINLSNNSLKLDLKFVNEKISNKLKTKKVKLLSVKEIKNIYSIIYT